METTFPLESLLLIFLVILPSLLTISSLTKLDSTLPFSSFVVDVVVVVLSSSTISSTISVPSIKVIMLLVVVTLFSLLELKLNIPILKKYRFPKVYKL